MKRGKKKNLAKTNKQPHQNNAIHFFYTRPHTYLLIQTPRDVVLLADFAHGGPVEARVGLRVVQHRVVPH